MRVLNDFGHTAIVVGNRRFKNGDKVEVKINDLEISVDKISEKNIRKYMLNLHDAKLYGTEVVGGKAMNLSTLKSKGYNVPHGFVITTAFFEQVVKDGKVDKKLYKEQIAKIINGINHKKGLQYAVRSSANVEDSKEYSFAGQFDSYLFVPFSQLEEKILQVLESTFSKNVKTYASSVNKKGVAKGIKMAVIVQEMVDADKAGVVFGKDVQTGSEDLVVIDVVKGVAEGVVEGTAETQRIIYSKNKDTVRIVSGSTRYLDRFEIDTLVEMIYGVEQLMGEIQDIEWAIDKRGNFWVIQSRPLS
jgi:pyruvate,water dikinase